MHLNVEIKARCAQPQLIRDRLLAKAADFRGLDHQVDTYYQVPNGRLKLRMGTIEKNLIHYQRSDQAGPKASEVSLFPVSDKGEELQAALERALGIKVIVDKQREIYFIDNVKFHLDEVKGLGSFVEIEAIDIDGTIGRAKLQAQCEHFMNYLQIPAADLIERSYSDLLLA